MFEFWHDFLNDTDVFVSTIFITLIISFFGWLIFKMVKDM